MAAGATYEPIATQTVGSATASVTFNSIPQTYTDLVIVGRLVEDTGGNNNCLMRFNSDSGTNYSSNGFQVSNATPGAYKGNNSTGLGLSYGNANSGRIPQFVMHVMNYSNSSYYKTALLRNGTGVDTGGWTNLSTGSWRSTSAVTTISFHTTNTNLGVGTTFTIYGIAAA